MRANFVLSGVATGIRRNVTMTIAIVLSTAIALGFVGAAILANFEINKFRKTYESQLHIQAYLCTAFAYGTQVNDITTAKRNGTTPRAITCVNNQATTPAQTEQIKTQLLADPAVAKVQYVTPDQNLSLAKKQQPASAAYLQPGDLPASFNVTLKDIRHDYDGFAKRFSDVQGIDKVNNQIDSIKALLSLIDSVRLFAIVVAAVVLVASVLLIGNTIQVAANQRRNETSIMRLVGASRWMTELPFMLETVIASLVGGIIAVGLIGLGKWYVLDNVLAHSTANSTIPNLGINEVLISGGIGVITGIALAALTAFVTLRVYVKV